MAAGIELVIFDCDGVLVDSERLAVRIESEVISSLGWALTEREIVDRFVGRSDAYMQAEIERHIGRTIDWDVEFAPRYREVFEGELTPVDGVVEALDAITLATCVASSGTHEKLREMSRLNSERAIGQAPHELDASYASAAGSMPVPPVSWLA